MAPESVRKALGLSVKVDAVSRLRKTSKTWATQRFGASEKDAQNTL